MDIDSICEYCQRPIIRPPTPKVIQGQRHLFCTEFCFRLYFYDVPRISYKDLENMYKLRCVTLRPPDFRSLIAEKD